VFEDATGRDLTQFKLWYSSAGTPKVTVTDDWVNGVYSLTLTQATAPTPGQDEKLPRLIPVAVGLLYSDGSEAIATKILELDKESVTSRVIVVSP
ncbi:MAG: aminopeptidase N, partial [Legionellales bacterium]